MEKTRRRGWRKQVFGLSAIIFAASFIVSLVPSIRAIAEGAIFKIKSAEITQLSSGVDGVISSHDDSTIVSDVTFHKLGDTATYKVVLQNTDSKDHVIETIFDDNANSHISYSYDKHANETIAAGANLDFVFEAKYVKTPNTNERQQVSKVKFSIRFTDIDEPEEVIVAPSTYDGLGASFVVLAISSLGLIVCAAFYIKNHKKSAKVLTVALVAALATAAITSVKAATVEVNSFTLTTNYGFYDKVVITYTDKNGDEQELISNYNEPANIPDQSKDGYTLTSWEDEQGNPVDPTQPITEDIKIHPIYRAHTYTIKLNGNGATGSMTDIAMTYDETKTLPANVFNFPGRTYTGWDTEANGSGIHYDNEAEVKNLTAEDNGIVTLYAQWSINPFHIDYDGNGATSGEMAATNCEYDQACQLRENAFVKTGYHFIGWKYNNNYYADKADVKNIIESGTITMVAQWEVNHYTVNFDINTDDTNVSGTMQPLVFNYDEEKALTANAFTRTGYTFAGWKLGDTEYTDGQTVKNLTAEDGAAITLKAQWTPTEYTIIFHANNDNVENPDAMTPQVITYDIDTELNANQYTWYQHKIVEWTTNANGTGTKYADKASVKNLSADGGEIHLYAKWREIDAALQAGGVGISPTGQRINGILTANPSVKRFAKYTAGVPSNEILASAVDTSATIDPIYLWADGENLYWWSEDEKPRISNRTDTDCLFNRAGNYTVDGAAKNLEYADLTGFDTSGITDYGRTFHSSGILEINISDWDFSNATNMREFIAYSAIKKAAFPEVVDARKVTNMSSALNFGMVTDELDLSGWKTRDVKNLSNFLAGMQAKKIKFSSDFKTDKVENMSSMFYGNSKLTSIEGLEYFNTEKVTSMAGMFNGDSAFTALDLSTFKTDALTTMSSMFSGMTSLNSLTLGGTFTAEHVTNFQNAFNRLSSIVNLDLSNLISQPTNFNTALANLGSNAKTIDISGMDLSKITNFNMTFHGDNGLETVYVSNSLNPEIVTVDGNAFLYNGLLTGGAGSISVGGKWTSDAKNFANIDDPDNGKPGYFTIKGARYIRYHDNDGDDTNDEANYALMKSHYLEADEHLKANTFTRDGYVFTGWKDADNNEYTDEQVMAGLTESKTPLELYAQWKELTAMLNTGSNVNAALKSINENAIAFTHYTAGTPDFSAIDGEQDIALATSNFPIYAWNDNGAIYWWSKADTVYMNSDSSYFFEDLTNLQSLDVTGLNTSRVTNMSYMFHRCMKLQSLDLSTFDTSNVINMNGMFMRCRALTNLNISSFNTSSVTNMGNMFNQDYGLTTINLSHFNTSNVKDMNHMFCGTTSLDELNITSFDTKKVTDMSYMFQNSAIKTIDLSSFYNVNADINGMFNVAENVITIYVGEQWTTTRLSEINANNIIGGAGTVYSATDKNNARLDDPDNGEPGYFAIKGARYIRYHDNDGDTTNDEANYALMKSEYLKAGGSLTKNAFTRSGYEFAGWKDADGNDYTDEQVMADLAESKTPLELYAQWDAAPYTVTFNANGGEVLQSTKTVTYLQPYGELPTPVKYDYANSILGGKYSFKGWNTEADGSGDTIAPSSVYANTDDATLYAIWNDHFTVTIYNGESETPTIANYGVDDIVYLNAQNVAGKQFLYWEVDGAKKAYTKDYSMRMFQGNDLTIRAIYGSESDLESQQSGTYISDIYRQYSDNRMVVRSYSYVPDGYEIVKSGVVATLDANIANGTFDDRPEDGKYVRVASVNGSSDNYYYTWSKSNVTSKDTVYVKAYLIYKDTNGVEHTIYGDLVTATLTE